ncbi:S-methyl-5-thioribose-1-phosphate isomerase, partial [Coniosporium uncinatum]
MVLEAIKYTRGTLHILDQFQLPHTTHYESITSTSDAFSAIKSMRTRGAPAIAIVAALSLAVELSSLSPSRSSQEEKLFVEEKLNYLVTSRPTAVNLADAARKLKKIVAEEAGKESATGKTVKDVYIEAAEKMLVDDVADNEAIGKYGAEWIQQHTEL